MDAYVPEWRAVMAELGSCCGVSHTQLGTGPGRSPQLCHTTRSMCGERSSAEEGGESKHNLVSQESVRVDGWPTRALSHVWYCGRRHYYVLRFSDGHQVLQMGPFDGLLKLL